MTRWFRPSDASMRSSRRGRESGAHFLTRNVKRSLASEGICIILSNFFFKLNETRVLYLIGYHRSVTLVSPHVPHALPLHLDWSMSHTLLSVPVIPLRISLSLLKTQEPSRSPYFID